VSLDLRFIDDGELAREVGRAQLVVLPYAEMHNSGAALLALSLRRPVLVPDNEVNRALAHEVGARWVQTYAGELTAARLRQAIAATTGLDAGDGPDLSGRGWTDAGARHRAVYEAAIARRRAATRGSGRAA
jgi:hypothetical protein